jgi:hypothetical protein
MCFDLHRCLQVISRSSRKKISVDQSIIIDHLVPSHWTRLKNWVGHWKSTEEEISFKNLDNLLNKNWKPNGVEVEDDSLLTYKFPVWNTIWTSIHTMIITYMLWKLKLMPYHMLTQLGGVEANSEFDCNLRSDVYMMLWFIVVAQISGFLFTIFKAFLRRINQYWQLRIDQAALVQMNQFNDLTTQ